MNRIFTLAIASTLIITGSSVFAQQLPRSPRPVHKTEVIQYAIERASEVPSYRGYRKSNVYVAPKSARTVVQRTYPNVRKKSPFTLSPLSPQQTIEAAPVIYGSSRRLTRIAVPAPSTEIEVSAPDPIEPVQTQIDVVRTTKPSTDSPNFEYRSRSDDDSEDLQLSKWQPQHKQVHSEKTIAISSPVELPKTTEATPVIPSSSRRVTKIAVPKLATEIPIPAPGPIESAKTQIDVVRTETPAKAFPNFKYQSPSDVDEEELQQSQWQPQPKPFQSAKTIADSSPVEQPRTIDPKDPFEAVAPAISMDNKTDAVPMKSALLGSEENFPFTSFIAESDRRPAVETGYTTNAVGPMAFATTELATKAKAELQTAKKVQTSAGKEASYQRTADVAWWSGMVLLAVPFLALLGWAIFGREIHHQFEEAPVIEIPLQSNTPWQFQESMVAQLSLPFASETDPQEIHCSSEESDAFESDIELLDEIHSINSIAFDSNSAARSTSNPRTKSDKN